MELSTEIIIGIASLVIPSVFAFAYTVFNVIFNHRRVDADTEKVLAEAAKIEAEARKMEAEAAQNTATATNQLMQSIIKLSEVIGQKDARLDKLEVASRAKETEIRKLQDQITLLQTADDVKSKRIAELETHVAKLELAGREKDALISQLRTELDQLKAARKADEATITELRKQKDLLEKRLRDTAHEGSDLAVALQNPVGGETVTGL